MSLVINGKSPSNPSRSATASVTNPLPAPTACPYCKSAVQLVENDVIYGRHYGRHYGEWPWAYRCAPCDAYVGLHPFTNIPLGTLATAPVRDARKQAKAHFNPLWQNGEMSRSEAYAWLAKALRIANVNECHIGWFDIDRCADVVKAVKAYRKEEADRLDDDLVSDHAMGFGAQA